MTARLILSWALMAGLTYTEALTMRPGMIIDLYIIRRNHEDQRYGIRREE